MVTQIIAGLKNFFIFNSTLGTKEGEELKKILYYYPITENTDIQIKNVGLVEGIIQFTETFKPSSPVSSLHTNRTRHLYYQPEKNYWMVMTLQINYATKEGSNDTEDLQDDIEDNVYESILKQAYLMYRLFWNTFESVKDIGNLKKTLELFYRAYIQNMKLANADILNILSGIQYLPLDKQTFLKVQCFINCLESNYGIIKYTSFLFNDHLIWSGVEPTDMQIVYQYLINNLLPANIETELQGGSIPRNSPSPFAALRHGRFITGPSNLKLAKTIGKVPKVYLFASGEARGYHLVVYRVLSATICLFIKGDIELTLDLFKVLDEFLNSKLISIVSDIAEYCSKQVVTPSGCSDSSPRFIYFNKLNLAYKSTVHLDNKQSGNIACPKESMKIAVEMKANAPSLGQSGETIVKTMNDYWVVMKVSNNREFYIALQQKNASLIDISEEVRRICETELKGIFFPQM
ncbi:vacuolar fusion protein CCZ1 homolog [Diorhabda carinulata]|uniref:vacuolar fusion protein CCZ1 homolog n=1 Tax=Diorhabda carinulata TaxID=1163345 RepID=UPI0025A2F0E8|nr:vacuolar fusion protein CCZ1 homolog [Diorhabda carinulata]